MERWSAVPEALTIIVPEVLGSGAVMEGGIADSGPRSIWFKISNDKKMQIINFLATGILTICRGYYVNMRM